MVQFPLFPHFFVRIVWRVWRVLDSDLFFVRCSPRWPKVGRGGRDRFPLRVTRGVAERIVKMSVERNREATDGGRDESASPMSTRSGSHLPTRQHRSSPPRHSRPTPEASRRKGTYCGQPQPMINELAAKSLKSHKTNALHFCDSCAFSRQEIPHHNERFGQSAGPSTPGKCLTCFISLVPDSVKILARREDSRSDRGCRVPQISAQTVQNALVSSNSPSNFEFVSDFELRISDLRLCRPVLPALFRGNSISIVPAATSRVSPAHPSRLVAANRGQSRLIAANRG